jgi:hypothetical protein
MAHAQCVGDDCGGDVGFVCRTAFGPMSARNEKGFHSAQRCYLREDVHIQFALRQLGITSAKRAAITIGNRN